MKRTLITTLLLLVAAFSFSQTNATYNNLDIRNRTTLRGPLYIYDTTYFKPSSLNIPFLATGEPLGWFLTTSKGAEAKLVRVTLSTIIDSLGASMEYWDLDADTIINKNRYLVKIDSALYLPGLKDESKLAYVLGWLPATGNTYPVPISTLSDTLTEEGIGYWEHTGNYLYPIDFATDSVGIGTDTPVKLFHVEGDARVKDTLHIGNSDITKIYENGTDKFMILVNDLPFLQYEPSAGPPGYNMYFGMNAGGSSLENYGCGFGNAALSGNSGNYVHGFGSSVASNNTGSYVSAFGVEAARDNKGTYVVGFGHQSAYANEGYYSVGIGDFSIFKMKGSYNTGIGYSSLKGTAVVANNTGAYNTAIGYNTMPVVTSGSNNSILGAKAGELITTGSSNVLIGYSAGATLTTESNKLYIENSNSATPLIYGDFAADSVVINGDLTVTGHFINEMPHFFVDYLVTGNDTVGGSSAGNPLDITTRYAWTKFNLGLIDTETDGFTLIAVDTLRYDATLDAHIEMRGSINFTGGNGEDWEIAVWNVTDDAIVPTRTTRTTSGSTNLTGAAFLAYDINANPGDKYCLKIRNMTNSNDMTIFYVTWLGSVLHFE